MASPPELAPPAGLLLCDDLIFASRITATAHAAGFTVSTARTAEQLQALARQTPPRCILVDLANPTLRVTDFVTALTQGRSPRPRVVAYGSHVDTATLRAAREAGCDLVLPRSAFVENLETELPKWLAAPGAEGQSQ